MKKVLIATAAVTVLLLAGCSQNQPETDVEQTVEIVKPDTDNAMAGAPEEKKLTAPAMGNKDAVMASLDHPDRSEIDKESDEPRKAADVLEFTGVWPGMTVLEMEAGSGYYTELLSRIVGPDGRVIRQNPKPFDAFFKPEDIEARFGPGGERLPNVEHLKVNFDEFESIADNSVDLVTWFLGPHELFFTPDDGNTFGTPEKSYAEIYRVLKPGGKFVALDHKTTPGAPETSGNTTHRIDPAAVRERAENAGLQFSKASNVLANSTDDYNKNVFDPAVRRKTDRFLHMYEKPNTPPKKL